MENVEHHLSNPGPNLVIDGLFLLDYHCDRMIESAKELALFFSNDPETFLRDLIPTRSELTNKLEAAVKNAGKDQRQRVKREPPYHEEAVALQAQIELPEAIFSFA